MGKISACPDVSQLNSFTTGHLPSPEMDALVEHLHSCPECLAKLPMLPSNDTLVDALVRANTLADGPQDVALQHLVDRLVKLAQASAANPAGNSASSEARTILPDTPNAAAQGTIAPQTQSGSSAASAARENTEALSAASDEGIDFLLPPQQPDEIGRLGHYRILKKLGAGGMGMVFLAEDTMLQRKVALKTMLPQYAANPRARERFLREARAAASIEHEHIVAIHQVGEDNKVPFLAMPFLKGEPLDERIEKAGKLPLAEALRIAAEIAEGLAAAHAVGLIHRDIKPGNVWLETRQSSLSRYSGSEALSSSPLSRFSGRGLGSEGGRVKLLDFGLARSQADNVKLTQSGALVGTPAYMAPEQAKGGDVDERADLFSLGCVLYLMLTGERPFKGDNTISVLTSLALETPKLPQLITLDVPGTVSALTMQLLEKDPAKRPPSAAAVAEQIRALLASTSVSSPDHTATLSRPNAATAAHPVRAKSRSGLLIACGLAAVLVAAGVAGVIILRPSGGEGEFHVDVPDDNVAVLLNKHGGITLIDRATKKEYHVAARKSLKMPPGEYQLVVTDDNGLEFSAKEFTLRGKDATASVKVWFKASNVAQVKTPAIPDKGTNTVPTPSVLFNGKDLTGFDAGKCWHVEDGVIKAEATSKVNQELKTTAEYTDFELAFQFRCPPVDDDTNRMPRFWFRPGGTGTIFFHSSGVTVSKGLQGRTQVNSAPLRANDFNDVSVRCVGKYAKIVVNGETLAQGNYDLLHSSGQFTWQPCTEGPVMIRNIRFVDLSKKSEVPNVASAFDQLKRENIPADLLTLAGGGDPAKAPAELVAVIGEPGGGIGVNLTADGRRAVFTNLQGAKLRLWDVATAAKLADRHKYGAGKLSVLSPDGKKLALEIKEKLAVTDALTGEESFASDEVWAKMAIISMAFSPDGNRLAVVDSRDLAVKILDANKGQVLFTLDGHTKIVVHVVYSPDGKHLATSSTDGTVRIWDAATGKETLKLAGQNQLGVAPAFSPDGSRLAALTKDIAVWEVASGKKEFSIARSVGCHCVTFSPDGKSLAVAYKGKDSDKGKDSEIQVRDAAKGSTRAQKWILPGEVLQMAYAADGRHLVVGTTRGVAYVLRIAEAGVAVAPPQAVGSPFDQLKRENIPAEALKIAGGGNAAQAPPQLVAVFGEAQDKSPVPSLKVSPDGRRLFFAVGSSIPKVPMMLQAWDIATGQDLPDWRKPIRNGPVLSHDGRRLARDQGQFKGIAISDTVSGEDVIRFGAPASFPHLAFNHDGTRLATAYSTERVKIWDTTTGQVLFNLSTPLGNIGSLVFSPDGKWLAGHSSDDDKQSAGFITVWNAHDGTEVFRKPAGSISNEDLVISPDSTWLAVRSEKQMIAVLDLATGNEKALFQVKAAPAAVSPDGKLIAALSASIIVLDATSGKKLQEWYLPTRSHSVAFAPDGRHLVVGMSDGTVYVLRMESVPIVVPPVPAGSPFDQLKRENIPAEALKIAGGGNPALAIPQLVAVFGESDNSVVRSLKVTVFERFFRSLKSEALDRMMFFSEQALRNAAARPSQLCA